MRLCEIEALTVGPSQSRNRAALAAGIEQAGAVSLFPSQYHAVPLVKVCAPGTSRGRFASWRPAQIAAPLRLTKRSKRRLPPSSVHGGKKEPRRPREGAALLFAVRR